MRGNRSFDHYPFCNFVVRPHQLHSSARRRWPILFSIVLFLAVPPTAGAQPADSTQAARFQLADAFLRSGQVENAIALLEDLYTGSPENYAFYSKLKEAYESVKRYDDAVTLVEQRLGAERSPTLLSDLARLYYLQNLEAQAFETWDEAIATAPSDAGTYRVVYQSLLELRLFDRAIETLTRAREATGRADLFRTDLAYLYGLTGQHGAAMEEYLGLLNENPQQLGFVRSRLSRFMEQEEALRSSLAAASQAVRREPLNRAYRELLGWLYLEADDYRGALDTYRAIDRLENENGQVLFQFAQMAADAAAYDVASEAFEEILERYPGAPSAPLALAGFGEMHERWADQAGEQAIDEAGKRIEAPHYSQALESYRRFLDRYPSNALYPEVLRRVGRLQQDVFFDLDAAQKTLEQVLTRYPQTRAADQAEYDLARAAVMRGRLNEAKLLFNRLIDRLRTGDLAELARYNLARVHFFTGEFDAAQSLVDIIDVNTSTDVSNDAIELKLLLLENRGPDSLNTPLRSYARALLEEERRNHDEALATLDSLVSRIASHALVDDARFLRGQILRTAGRTQEAHAAFAEFPLLHPSSHLADRALFAAGEILEYDLKDPDAAIATYARLLSQYPGSLLASQARDRIRRLRGDGAS